jgi:hypothetical protein
MPFIGIFTAFTIFTVLASRADANIFYTSSNYTNGSAGVITGDGGNFTVLGKLVSNLGLDASGFTFTDHDGKQRAMIREYTYGPNDSVYVWDPANWLSPLVNTKSWGSNIHAVASDGRQYLYLTTYESYKDGSFSQDTGEVVRIDMKNNYEPDKRYRYEAFTGGAGYESSPHGEAIFCANGKVYVLFAVSYNGVTKYEPSEIIEFDANLNALRKAKLDDGKGNTGRNAGGMAYHDGKLYVSCMGGYQGPDSWGDIWEVDISDMAADAMPVRRVLAGADIPDGSTAVGMYGVQFAPDGAAYILTGSYDSAYNFRARLFRTTASDLSAGGADKLTLIKAYSRGDGRAGYSWQILYDDPSGTLWWMTGRALEAYSGDGEYLRSFTPNELGDNIYSFSLLNGISPEDIGADPGEGGAYAGENGARYSYGAGSCDTGAGALFALLMTAVVTCRRR